MLPWVVKGRLKNCDLDPVRNTEVTYGSENVLLIIFRVPELNS